MRLKNYMLLERKMFFYKHIGLKALPLIYHGIVKGRHKNDFIQAFPFPEGIERDCTLLSFLLEE